MSDRDQSREPRPEQIAAYLDGELHGAPRREVAAWLSEHPEAAAEADAQRGLARLWASTAPETPSAERWEQVFGRIQAAVAPDVTSWRRRSRRALWIATALLGTAAAILVLVAWNRSASRPETPAQARRDVEPASNEPLPVLTSHEVQIISMNDADRGALLVGEPPFQDPLTLLARGEVTVDQLEKDDDGTEPHYSGDASASPMIVAPVRPRSGK